MKKLLTVLIAAALMCGCASGATNMRILPAAAMQGMESVLPKRVVFALDKAADDIMLNAAENLCERITELSNGSMTLELKIDVDPIGELRAETAQFILIEGDQAENLHPFFKIANEPFRYRSWEVFSMACNSEEIMQMLSDECGQQVLGAYYTGSNLMASFVPLGSTDIFTSDPEQGIDPLVDTVYTIPGSDASAAFGLLQANVEELPSLAQRVQNLMAGDMLIELSPRELTQEALNSEDIILTRTYHSIAPAWLILSPTLYQNLTQREKAIVDEAAACLAGDLDFIYLEQEQAALDALAQAGLTVTSDFAGNRNVILRARAELRGNVPVLEARFRESLDRVA